MVANILWGVLEKLRELEKTIRAISMIPPLKSPLRCLSRPAPEAGAETDRFVSPFSGRRAALLALDTARERPEARRGDGGSISR